MNYFNQYRRFNVCEQDNAATLENLLAAVDFDYPAQSFVGVDSAGRACVILHFDDAEGNRDFQTFYFKTHEKALAAFRKLEKKLSRLDEENLRAIRDSFENSMPFD